MSKLMCLLTAGAVALVGCSDPAPTSQTTVVHDGPDSSVNEASWTVNASAYERRLIDDGDASVADIDQATDAVVACLAEKGFPGAEYTLHLPWDYGFDVSGAGSAAAHQACEEEYLDAVSAMYFDQYGPTDDEIDLAYEYALQCLEDAGVDVPDESEFVDVMKTVDHSLSQQCLVAAEDRVRPPT